MVSKGAENDGAVVHLFHFLLLLLPTTQIVVDTLKQMHLGRGWEWEKLVREYSFARDAEKKFGFREGNGFYDVESTAGGIVFWNEQMAKVTRTDVIVVGKDKYSRQEVMGKWQSTQHLMIEGMNKWFCVTEIRSVARERIGCTEARTLCFEL